MNQCNLGMDSCHPSYVWPNEHSWSDWTIDSNNVVYFHITKGVQAKEAFKINGSLKVLGDVIEAIKKNQKHVPFRFADKVLECFFFFFREASFDEVLPCAYDASKDVRQNPNDLD